MGDALAGLELLLNAPDKEVSDRAPTSNSIRLLPLAVFFFSNTSPFNFNRKTQQTVVSLMDDAFARRDAGWTTDRRRAVAHELSLAGDAELQVAALFASAVHLIKVERKRMLLVL